MNEDGFLVLNLKRHHVSPYISPPLLHPHDALELLQTQHSRVWFWESFLHPWGNQSQYSEVILKS